MVSAGVDALTYSFPSLYYEDEVVKNFFNDMVLEIGEKTKPLQDKKTGGYEGFGNDHCHIGVKGDWALFSVTGALADEMAVRLSRATMPGRATRIDLQVTADYGELRETQAQEWYETAKKKEEIEQRARRHKKALFEADGCGTGLTLGSRSSESYTRIYHPFTKHGAPFSETMWRFEQELKGGKARGAWERVKGGGGTNGIALSALKYQCQEFGLHEWWMSGIAPEKVRGVYRDKKAENTFEWLNTTAGPALLKLGQREPFKEDVKALLKNWLSILE